MTNNDYKMILQRLAGLEDQVGRIKNILTDQVNSIGVVQALPAYCSKCEQDWRAMDLCLEQDCPCGKN